MEQSYGAVTTALQALAARAPEVWRLDACGVTRSQRAIPALLHRHAYEPQTTHVRVLLIAGLDAQAEDVALALQALEMYVRAGERLKDTLALSAVPCANPDGFALGVAPENGVGGFPARGYPPDEHFFYDARNPEQRYLWRWIGLQAPDLVLELRVGPRVAWESPVSATLLSPALEVQRMATDDTLLAALSRETPNGIGAIPGLRLTTPTALVSTELQRLWTVLLHPPQLRASPARRGLEGRRARSPLDIARLLATVYGHRLDPMVYTQGMSISGRLRLARLDPTFEDPVPSLVQLVEPYVSGALPLFPEPATPTAMGGLIWGMQLAEATRDRRYADVVVRVAERYRAGGDGEAPPPSDADFRTEDICMNGAMLGRAFRLTGNSHYLELLTTFLLTAATQQDNGLFWHSRSTPYYWGRANGFAALGYTETLTYLPADHPAYAPLLAMHVHHLEALRSCQHPSGMYPQVLDVPGSYHELTVTCMVGYAMARAWRRGWVDASYRAAIDLAWQGVAERIDDAAGLVDCCTNTGVQENLQAYLDRPAIFGRDDRGGALAMWFALELEQLRRTRRST